MPWICEVSIKVFKQNVKMFVFFLYSLTKCDLYWGSVRHPNSWVLINNIVTNQTMCMFTTSWMNKENIPGISPGEGGTLIWIGRGCVAGSSLRPIPTFRGNFSKSKYRYPYLGLYWADDVPDVINQNRKGGHVWIFKHMHVTSLSVLKTPRWLSPTQCDTRQLIIANHMRKVFWLWCLLNNWACYHSVRG